MLGIHASAPRCLPLFLVYLATLTHTHGLVARHAAAQRAAAAAAAPAAPVPEGQPGARPAARRLELEAEGPVAAIDADAEDDEEAQWAASEWRPPPAPPLPAAAQGDGGALGLGLGNAVSGGVHSAAAAATRALLSAGAAAWEFVLTACTACERPPSYVLVALTLPAGADAGGAAALEAALQGSLDGWRAADLEAARHRRRRRGPHAHIDPEEEEEAAGSESWQEVLGASVTSSGAASLSSYDRASAASAPSPPPPPEQPEHPANAAPLPRPAGAPLEAPIAAASTATAAAGAAPPATHPDLSTVGPLRLRLHCFVDPAPGEVEVKVRAGGGGGGGEVRALLEVTPLPGDPANSGAASAAPGWPLRSLRPAAHAAATLLRGPPPPRGAGRGAARARVLAAEPHSAAARDFYALTAALDILAFVFVAVYYNRVVQAAGSLTGAPLRACWPPQACQCVRVAPPCAPRCPRAQRRSTRALPPPPCALPQRSPASTWSRWATC